MATAVPISVVILTKNESQRIRDCIASVSWADEILIVDDDSTDDTVAIAASLGARVLHRTMDIEGRHRNWAATQASHEWILSLDADERVTPELAREIREVVCERPAFQTYAIPRRNYVGTRWIRYGGWYPSAQLKLFMRSIFHWEEAAVHPRALADVPCGQLRGDIMHYSYRDVADFMEKTNRHSTLEAQKWLTDGRRMSLGKVLWRATDRFFRSLIGKQGFRDGGWGWLVAWMAAAYQLLSYAKYCEVKQALCLTGKETPLPVQVGKKGHT